MAQGFEPGALLGRVYTLPSGLRVRLRLLRPTDADAVGELCARCGADAGELELARLVRADPRWDVIACASALIGSSEVMMGIAALDLRRDQQAAALVIDPAASGGLDELLVQAVNGRAAELRTARAA